MFSLVCSPTVSFFSHRWRPPIGHRPAHQHPLPDKGRHVTRCATDFRHHATSLLHTVHIGTIISYYIIIIYHICILNHYIIIIHVHSYSFVSFSFIHVIYFHSDSFLLTEPTATNRNVARFRFHDHHLPPLPLPRWLQSALRSRSTRNTDLHIQASDTLQSTDFFDTATSGKIPKEECGWTSFALLQQ